MAEVTSGSAVGTNPPGSDDIDALDTGASTLIDLVWSLSEGQSVTSEMAWNAVHTSLRISGVAEDDGWTEKAVSKGLDIAIAARAVARNGNEPTISSVKSYLAAHNDTTGDYRKFSSIVAKAKARYLHDRKKEPVYTSPPEQPTRSGGGPSADDTRTADKETEAEPSAGKGLISFDLSERMMAAQSLRFAKEKDAALDDLRSASEIASRAQQSTIEALANQVRVEQQRLARSQRSTMVLTGITVATCVIALVSVIILAQRQPAIITPAPAEAPGHGIAPSPDNAVPQVKPTPGEGGNTNTGVVAPASPAQPATGVAPVPAQLPISSEPEAPKQP